MNWIIEAGPPDDQQETEEDLGSPSKRFDAVITATDWTVSTIVEQMRKGNIELNPDFQRRQAWRLARKSQFIESLIMGVPVPQIVLAERKGRKGSFIVIDGKQRLLTLRQFCSLGEDAGYTAFSLSGLSARRELNGLSYSQIVDDSQYDSEHSALDNSTIRTAVIRNWPDEYFLYTVFLRLNTGSVPLSPQELRQALHPGPFLKRIDDYAADSNNLRIALNLKEPDFRMRDTELVLRYFAFRNFLPLYTGNLKPFFDDVARLLNDGYGRDPAVIEYQLKDLDQAFGATFQIFGAEAAFRKWSRGRYERPLNRAVFDIMTIYFSDSQVAARASVSKNEVKASFEKLCETDDRFRDSIEGTTKSKSAIEFRLNLWGVCLSKIIEMDVLQLSPPLQRRIFFNN